ncbi:ABC transporter substrate-binding protein [Lampropedia puyangensis]|uniref:ABC transporter substrate-binding protein n=1 Tax=Lampropedia puyangensis TaxID=1330072 RepID=A0A4S8EYE4_9BURK|nr:ABC transporter substrate-binding protein [Lampropedia puyangensis]THT99626.1 ABC transporter substrate-binding protein [Lampropedia puyangensis]
MKFSRRTVFTTLALTALLGHTPLIAQTPAQKQNDTLIYLHSIESKSLFQWWTQATYPKRNVLDSLVYLDENNQLHPWLATEWKQDGTVWTFKLRDDVVFTDGTKLDAATVAKNFDFWIKLSTSVPDSFFKEAKAVDAHTVEFHTTVPQPYLADILSSALFGINSSPSLDRDLKDIGEKPIGSGPFTLKEWKHGEEIVFERNDAYQWGPQGSHGGPAYLKTVRWKFVPDSNARWLALEKGEADLIYEPPSVKWKEAQSKYLTSQRLAPGRNQALSLNVEAGPFTDKRIRQAFAYASNRQQIVESVFRGAVPYEGNGAYSKTTQEYLNLDSAYPHDPVKAVKLLEEAGYDKLNAEGYRVNSDGKVLEIVLPLFPTVVNGEGLIAAQALQAEVKKVGIKLNTFLLTQTELAAGRYTKADEYDIVQGYWTLYAPTVLSINYRPAGENTNTSTIYGRQQLNQYATDGGSPNPHNRVRSKDWKFQEAIIAAHEETDPAARTKKFQSLQQHISDEALALGFYGSAYNLVGHKYLKGLAHNTDTPVFYEVKKD